MDQLKAGSFLKELRKEKGITQEQLAEKLGVSRRTVSRWETGSNMPDLDLLIELADYYNTDIREILNGERKSEQVDKDLKETVLAVAGYENDTKYCKAHRFLLIGIGGLIAFALYFVMLFLEPEKTGPVYGFFEGLFLGIAFNAAVVSVIMSKRYVGELRDARERMNQ